MKIHLYILLITLLAQNLLSKAVSSESAKIAALNYAETFLISSKDDADLLTLSNINLVDYKVSISNDTLLFVFNLSGNGWIIMSGDDKVKPVIGYSVSGRYSLENQSPSFESWINYISEIIYNKISDPDANSLEDYNWYIKDDFDNELFQSSKKPIMPLLKTKWNQGYPYNLSCPIDPETGKRAITGCVATAMAQVLYFHRFPLKGKGKVEYKHKQFGDIKSDFSESKYQYGIMKHFHHEFKDSASKYAVSKLMFDCGVAVRMNYGLDASGASSVRAFDALLENFGFSADYKRLSQDISDEEWKNLLYDNLSLGLPMYYAGSSLKNGGGHAFVCDGYDNGFFHFNWGWGGSQDGYFEVGYQKTNLLYNSGQHIIAFAKPNDFSLGYGEIPSDKFEVNNSIESSTIIPMDFNNDKLRFYHILSIHDTNDVDYFKLEIPEDEDHYLLDLKYADSYYGESGDINNGAILRITVSHSGRIDTLLYPQTIKIENSGTVIIKVEPIFKYRYGVYIADFNLYRFNKPFIDVKLGLNNSYLSNEKVSLNWFSNLTPPFDIELINQNFPGKFFGKVNKFNGNNYLWQLTVDMESDNNYFFKITHSIDDKILGYSEPFEIKKYEYLHLETPHWANDIHIGIPFDITWETNFDENITLELLKDSLFFRYIAADVANEGVYSWLPDDSVTIGDNFRVKISKSNDYRIYSVSEDFSIQPYTSVEDDNKLLRLQLISHIGNVMYIYLDWAYLEKLELFDLRGNLLGIYNITTNGTPWFLPNLLSGTYFILEKSKDNYKLHKISL
ncbi:MAG: C10 family peptidase [Candidatus Kapabacteria bacterium]|nr:C10 family peptidase [Ignavibacteriota bacterium]MCW5886048.1 C10 family peptidase [Candidatus Kapabacteria bacterium]